MTNYQWDALLCEVARKVGWEHWEDDYIANGERIPRRPVITDEEGSVAGGEWLSTDDLNDIAALSEKAGVTKVDIWDRVDGAYHDWARFEVGVYIPKCGGFYEDPPHPDGEESADTLAHAWLLALASALKIDVEKFQEAK